MEGRARRRIGGHHSLLNLTFRRSTGRVSAGTEGSVIAAGRVMMAIAIHRASYWRHHLFNRTLCCGRHHLRQLPIRPRRDQWPCAETDGESPLGPQLRENISAASYWHARRHTDENNQKLEKPGSLGKGKWLDQSATRDRPNGRGVLFRRHLSPPMEGFPRPRTRCVPK